MSSRLTSTCPCPRVCVAASVMWIFTRVALFFPSPTEERSCRWDILVAWRRIDEIFSLNVHTHTKYKEQLCPRVTGEVNDENSCFGWKSTQNVKISFLLIVLFPVQRAPFSTSLPALVRQHCAKGNFQELLYTSSIKAWVTTTTTTATTTSGIRFPSLPLSLSQFREQMFSLLFSRPPLHCSIVSQRFHSFVWFCFPQSPLTTVTMFEESLAKWKCGGGGSGGKKVKVHAKNERERCDKGERELLQKN